MSKGLDVFGVKADFELAKAKETLEAKLNPQWIKQRQQGGATLSYIGGHTVIRLLNKAFNYQWSFEIVSEEVKQSVPKASFDGWGKNRKPKLDAQGNQIFEAQPPVAKVLGRLTVPGVGVKEQYGSKVLIGGATEQESAFKSASTDALKKCASLFGIGLELYGDDEGFDDDAVAQATQPTQVAPPQQQPQQQYQAPPKQDTTYQAPPQPQQQQAPAQQQTAPQQTATQSAPGQWNQDDINRLKELKAILGITENAQLDPYVREFFDNPNVNFGNITPENIKAVNIFLAKKAESL
jgi:hypothetical protein